MPEMLKLRYHFEKKSELNLCYMPFIVDGGGIFLPIQENIQLGDLVHLELKLPTPSETHVCEGKVVWIIPKNALYHVQSGIGIQLTGLHAKVLKDEIKMHLDKDLDVGGYVYGISSDVLVNS